MHAHEERGADQAILLNAQGSSHETSTRGRDVVGVRVVLMCMRSADCVICVRGSCSVHEPT